MLTEPKEIHPPIATVPPDSNHQPVNMSDDDDLVLIVARNAPVEIVVDLEAAGR